MVPLDRKVPFVRAVLRAIETGGPLRPAAELLLEAERLHGVEIVWAPETSLGAGSFRRRPDAPSRPAREAVLLSNQADAFDEEYEFVGEVDDRLVDGLLFPFLTNTSLVLQGMDFTNDFVVHFDGGTIACWTQRSWGALLAEWANRTKSLPPAIDLRGRTTRWNYVQLYCHAEDVIEDYGPWSTAVRTILRWKHVPAIDVLSEARPPVVLRG